jgi:hypothetical protein
MECHHDSALISTAVRVNGAEYFIKSALLARLY